MSVVRARMLLNKNDSLTLSVCGEPHALWTFSEMVQFAENISKLVARGVNVVVVDWN